MNSGGRSNVVSDEEILDRLVGDDPFYSTTEVAEPLAIKHMGVYKRLVKLEDRGLVESKRIGNGRAWWLTDAGEDYLDETGTLSDSEA